MSMTTNLDSASSTGTEYSSEVTVYDSLGESHVVTVTFEQTGTNTWSYSAALPASDFTSGTSTAVTGTMNFDADGVLTSIQPTGAANPSTVGTATGDVSSITLGFTGLADGANDLSISWNLLGASGTPNISQVDTTSATSSTTQNGYASGQYESFAIGSDGTVTVSYSNGEKQDVGQLALANVNNLQGLRLLGDGDYATTQASGTAAAGVSGSSGLGTLEDDALEGSNVNISSAFSELIIAQRAFEADSKAVTTFDTVTQDTMNMIH
jgi:flagellar hook protein FlgE